MEYISGDTGLFNAVNMVLEKRPSQDTQVTATHTIESVQLQRYAELYPQNEKLQQLKKAACFGRFYRQKDKRFS